MSHQTYAPLRTSFWTDPDVRAGLPAIGKYLASYYFSAPESNLAGLYSAPYDLTAKRTDLPTDVVRFHTQVTLVSYVTYDERTEEVFVHAAAKHRIGDTLADKDKRRGGIKRLWMDCHSPLLRFRFLERYATWALDLPEVRVPDGYKSVVLPPPEDTNRRGFEGASGIIGRSSSSCSSTAGKETTGHGASGIELKPEYTKGELIEAARKVCGLGLWDRQEEGRANSVIVSWYGEGIKPERIWAAIHGARILCDAGEVEWLAKGKPFGLRALRNTHTLYNQGDGKAERPMFDVAEEAYYRDATPSNSKTRTLGRISVSLPEGPHGGAAA